MLSVKFSFFTIHLTFTIVSCDFDLGLFPWFFDCLLSAPDPPLFCGLAYSFALPLQLCFEVSYSWIAL